MGKKELRQLILSGEFAVLIAIFSQFSLRLGVVPFTGQTLIVGLVATILSTRESIQAVGIYLLMGLIGLPIFANFHSGFGVLFGPTGGYLIGFLFNAWITSGLLKKFGYTYTWAVIANLLGAIVTLVFGTIWLKFAANLTFTGAFAGGFTPFILPGIAKAMLAAYGGVLIRKRLEKFLSPA